ncbi:MAG: DUF1501 domain-containing protein [Pyrinomonadaceae bacterium]|nr:DUF1501 domain-containing protein [Pyrinomonadaceae bacterium]MBP6211624.1 DUF1501 domain-containing protein [Pyrinomonadaceae bacterium]
MDRRFFLKTSGIGLASFGVMAAAPGFLHQFAAAQTSAKGYGKKKVLVTIFQRGAVDGLNMIVPHGEDQYYGLRPTIAIPGPNKTDGAVDLDGFFGLHPSMKPLETFWRSKQLAVIHSVGSPDNTRSHFDAQDYMESGTPGNKGTRDGWLNRVLQSNTKKDDSPFRAVSFTQQLPRSLYGRSPSVAMTSLGDFAIKAGIYTQNMKGGFEGLYEQNAKDSLGETGKETFEAVNYLKQANPAQYTPENGAVYPNSALGRSLKQIAQLIKAGVGLEVAFAEMNGWDTHSNEGGSRGQLANLLRDFASSIAAFGTDLGKLMDDVVLITMSEFGRTAKENGSRGTDHGHANSMLILGNSVKGGKVYGDWKGLKNDKLYEGRDLDVTTDFRDVFAEAAQKHLGTRDIAKIFPNYTITKEKFRGYLG